jgi:hypothetical protein
LRGFQLAVGELLFPHKTIQHAGFSPAYVRRLWRWFQMSENVRMTLLELLLGGFFAVACVRSSVPSAVNGKLRLGDLLRFPGRLERLRRTRWQWFSMVALLLAVRMQTGVPTILEAIVAVQFAIFFALPTRTGNAPGKGRSGYEPVLGSR